jgi:hypothetical protein
LWDWRSGGGVAFEKGTLISSIFDKRYIHIIPARPRVNIDSLKADGPDAAKKYEDTNSDEKEMRGR